MSWARLDDAILDNPKIIAAGPLGFALHVAAITWCARNLTDGYIPKRRVAQLLDLPSLQVSETTKVRVLHALTADDLASTLVAVGLWHDRGESWELHDFLKYNFSRAQVLARREKAAARVKKFKGLRDNAAGNAVTNALVTRLPGPGPGPVPGSERSESLWLIAPASPAAQTRPGRAKPKVSWPDGFALTDARAVYATRQGLDASYEWGKFRAHALRDDVRHVNWERAWEYWVRNAWEIARRHA